MEEVDCAAAMVDDIEMTAGDIRTHGEQENQSTDSEFGKTFLSFVWSGGKLGAGYYDTETCILHLLPEQSEAPPGFTVLRKLLKQVQPSYLVLSSNADERILRVIKETVSVDESLDASEVLQDIIKPYPASHFGFECAKNRLRMIRFPGMPANISRTEKEVYFAKRIDFQSVNMVRAAGGLLRFLDEARVNLQLEEDAALVPVLATHTLILENSVYMDQNSYSALQIFTQESHPSAFKHGFATKEGLSLFGVFNRCRSTLGSKELRRMFLRPTKDLVELQSRQDAIAYLLNPRNTDVSSSLHDCIKHIKNISRLLSTMMVAGISVSDWHMLYTTIYNAILIGEICRAQPNKIVIFNKIGQALTPDLHRIASLIEKIIDFEESYHQNRFVVKPGVDEKIDEKKRQFQGLPDFLRQVAEQELEDLHQDVDQCSVIYIPQIGYLLAIPATEALKAAEYAIPNLNYIFVCNETAHYKTERTLGLDASLGDTHFVIADMETEVMHRLQEVILESSDLLISVMEYAAQMDCLLCLSSVAREFGYTRPVLRESDPLIVSGTKSKHPLQELCVELYVDNDVRIGAQKVLVLTGPNASGKSVYLKQVGLLVYLAHLGSFVPAQSAEIGLVDAIFTRIFTPNSVSLALSDFMTDISQMARALEQATSRSLVIIDEFGQGTEAVDGLALLTSSLKHWMDLGRERCPLVLVSTHYHSLVNLLPANHSPLLAYYNMDVLFRDRELVFLYKVKEGVSNGSYAHFVAASLGIQEDLISRCQQISEWLRRSDAVPPLETESYKIRVERCNKIVSIFMDADLKDANLEELLTRIRDAGTT